MKILVDKKPESCKECLLYKEIENVDGVKKNILGGGAGGGVMPPEYTLIKSRSHKCIVLNKTIPMDIAEDVFLKDCPLAEYK